MPIIDWRIIVNLRPQQQYISLDDHVFLQVSSNNASGTFVTCATAQPNLRADMRSLADFFRAMQVIIGYIDKESWNLFTDRFDRHFGGPRTGSADIPTIVSARLQEHYRHPFPALGELSYPGQKVQLLLRVKI